MSEAKWKLMVDWGRQRQVHGRTMTTLPRRLWACPCGILRDLDSEHIGAARLDIRLANADHKYSPPNGKSALSGNLEPGRKVWLRAAFPLRYFRRRCRHDSRRPRAGLRRIVCVVIAKQRLSHRGRRRRKDQRALALASVSLLWTSRLPMRRWAAISCEAAMPHGTAG